MNEIERMKVLAGINETKIEPPENSSVPDNKNNALQKDTEQFSAMADSERKIKVPKEIFSSIDKRIKELKDSIEQFDNTTDFKTFYPSKQKAIDCLEFIKDKLKMKNAYAYKEAIVYMNSIKSDAQQLFPADMIKYLHSGQANM